ncbi:MAG TPA: ABC transporter substrate-binding protein [Solirubrobacteraceae bacterium]|jgi:NitT/TauT family transport system substrate-binding protein/putative hydroxymethylpyrimidine transport system substrate-binding protein
MKLARPTLAAACALIALALGACGSGKAPDGTHKAQPRPAGASAPALPSLPPPLQKRTVATLVLDFTPNAVHAGIYRALAEGLYRQEHIDLHVIVPSETQDPLTLVDAGRADFGLSDGSDLATLIDKGGEAQAVMAIAQRPLGGLITRASEHLRNPAQLQGRKVGITGVPSDTAVLDTEVRAAGGDPAKVHVVTVGFDGAEALRAGKIAAFTGFWPDDGVQLQVSGEPVRSFKLDDWGGPAYPGLVAFATRRTIAQRPALVRDFVAATVRGYELTLREPKRSLSDLLHANPEVEARVAKASLAAYLPLFAEDGKVPFGTLQQAHVLALSRWMVSHELIASPVPFARYGTNRFLPGR